MIKLSLHSSVALLIDADNVQSSQLESVLEISEYYGKLVIRRAYGDWKQSPLASHVGKFKDLKIECVQVNRVGKNATDHHLLVDAGRISEDLFVNTDVFVIVSGDGGFTSACEALMRKVVVIGGRGNTAHSLQHTCDEFYHLEDLEQQLSELKKHYPIPPSEVRSFALPLLAAYCALTDKDDWAWVSFSQLGSKLHELSPDYKSQFGKYPLSEWLKNFSDNYETRDQQVRKIDPNPEHTRWSLLVGAYLETKRPDGLASLSELGNALRELARDYESQFGNRKLSAWIEDYPDTFEIRGNSVIHANHICR